MKFKKLYSAFLILTAAMSTVATASERSTYSAYKWQRGYSQTIPESRVIELCADVDGCKVRISMYDWDGNRRTASRETLFHYNQFNRTWRDSSDDTQGTNSGGGTQHIQKAWSCYFTDGAYINWANIGDISNDFSVLSWNQYNATCRVTLID